MSGITALAINDPDPSWSLGTLVWLPVVTVLIAAFALLAVHCWRLAEREQGKSYSDRGLFLAATVGCVVTILALIGGTAWGMYPYAAEYHQWRDVSGDVTDIDKRLLGSESGMEEKFVVRFDDEGQQYGCNDTRCASVKVGDTLALTCKRTWQFTGTDGYDCRFVGTDSR